MNSPVRTPLSATVSRVDTLRTGKGPLGALPALSASARRALAFAGVLALFNAAALVAQAFLLASVLAALVAGQTAGHAGALAALLAVVLARSVIGWGIRVVAARAAAGAKEELRAKTVDHALRLGPEWIARHGPGELTTLTTKGLDALDAYFTEYLPALVTAAVVPLGVGAAVLVADWPSAVIIALTLPLLPMFAILIGKHTADRVASATDAVHRLSGHLLELVRALPVLAAFRRADAQAEAVRRVSDRHRRTTLDTLRVAFASAFALELAATLSVALVAVVIGVRLVYGDMSLAIGLGVLILAPECFQPLRTAGAAFHASDDGVEAVRRVADVLAEQAPTPGSVPPKRGEVRVSGLRVARRGGYAPDGESFTARAGSTVWLRSPSGAGKSTTLSVLLGFATPADGTVTIGGTPLNDVDMSAWRESIAWVPQSPAFAGGTVGDELELAAPGSPHVDAVLTQLGLTGLQARPVGRLSTGQRQRVAVARALLRVRAGAWLLLLDEPTAHLDAANAERVLAAIRDAERAGAAVVIAAHERAALGSGDEPVHAQGDAEEADERRSGNSRLRSLLSGRFLGGAALGAAALLAGVALTATSGWLIAKASQQPPILTLTVAVVGVRTFGLARAGLRYVERLVTHDAAFRIAERLRVRLWRALVRLGPAHTLGLRRGEGQRRLVADVDTVRDLLPRVVTPPLVVAAVVLGACGIQAIVLPEAGVALAVAALVAVMLAPGLALLVERHATSALAEGRRTVAERVLGLFDVAAELIAFGAHRARRADLAAADADLTTLARKQALGAGAADAVITLATGAAAVASTWSAAGAVAAGTLNPVVTPLLALVPLALAEVLSLLPPAAQHLDSLRQAHGRLAATWDRPSPPAADRIVRGGDGVSLRGVDVRWPGGAEPVLRDLDLDLAPGARVAVVGPSGAGKSTLLATLLGFLAPEDGHASLPTRVAWAPQEPQLVSTTVAENLRLADPHATDERLTEALRIVGLPDLELRTVLSSAGAGLSGGQAQRLALARAVLAAGEADLVLLDEPTAHLDEPTARLVLANLDEALAGKTVVHVTHRPEEVRGADVVLEVGEGQITARQTALAGGGA
ncbi:thiol reductant ABC exporter subunit CydD [Prauserella cavernicola]|uniref:Thiol reductant ABC exporter subunit CydD n=1 Tax=Prauserella cavernicola TaxID=2800127 RepID=A0A934QQS2_9PSEU|nr:thiol reductant ABC exporter subunit CydD [Prauserella cavernicola]MBK1784411.1 thiol reductant ABC exporter subunit CydD [Prauserella cavernicola]